MEQFYSEKLKSYSKNLTDFSKCKWWKMQHIADTGVPVGRNYNIGDNFWLFYFGGRAYVRPSFITH